VPNASDNCFLDANADQADVDNDGDGDACDPDTDGDGWSNDNDSCPFDSDPSHADSDGDGTGDACDKCPNTSDEVTAWTSGNPDLGIDPKPIQPDSDGDGTPDACEPVIKINGKVLGWKNQIKPGKADKLQAQGVPDTFQAIPISPTKRVGVNHNAVFGQNDRRLVKLSGLDPEMKTWISDDDGRTVAHSSTRNGKRRSLLFRPLAGHRYYLHVFFSPFYERSTEDFQAEVTSKTVRDPWPKPPPAHRRHG
jgi:hypothetical protein